MAVERLDNPVNDGVAVMVVAVPFGQAGSFKVDLLSGEGRTILAEWRLRMSTAFEDQSHLLARIDSLVSPKDAGIEDQEVAGYTTLVKDIDDITKSQRRYSGQRFSATSMWENVLTSRGEGSARVKETVGEMLKAYLKEKLISADIVHMKGGNALLVAVKKSAVRQREVACLIEKYGLGDGRQKTFQEVGERVGVTEEQARSIVTTALHKLSGMAVRKPA